MIINDEIISKLLKIAQKAGSAILNVYKSEFNVYTKEDKSPLTEADKQAHEIIKINLENITPDVPILSEEGTEIDYNERSKWHLYWLIDPLDGTKEFIKKNDEFTVNIALMEYNKPVFGVVFAPVLNKIYWGGVNIGSFTKQINGRSKSITVNPKIGDTVHVAVSRSHPSDKLTKFLSQFNKYELYSMGSSLKMCLVAEGAVDCYPRLGPTMEWDTAASHAIILGSGGDLVNYSSRNTLEYNKKNLLNPEFIACHVELVDFFR